jgi:hypothetical protein
MPSIIGTSYFNMLQTARHELRTYRRSPFFCAWHHFGESNLKKESFRRINGLERKKDAQEKIPIRDAKCLECICQRRRVAGFLLK